MLLQSSVIGFKLFSFARTLSTNIKTVSIPKLTRIPELATLLRIRQDNIIKSIAIKEKKRYFCIFNDIWYQFYSVNEIIVPFNEVYKVFNKKQMKKEVLNIALQNCRPLPNPKINNIKHLPVVAIVGHFNHGKTTLLDALGGTKIVDDEAHGITQVRPYNNKYLILQSININ
jgi:hypothetical protein